MTELRGAHAPARGVPMSEARTPELSAGARQAEDSRAAQSRFVQDNLRRIFLQIYRIVGNVDDAQDLTQETFIKALQREQQVRDLERAGHWLSRIATNTAIDFLRRQGRLACSDVDEIPDILATPPEASPERLLLRAEHAAWLQEGLDQLSWRERAALVLRDVDGVPGKDVAKLLNCSEATVRSHIANARIKFRRYLERRPR